MEISSRAEPGGPDQTRRCAVTAQTCLEDEKPYGVNPKFVRWVPIRQFHGRIVMAYVAISLPVYRWQFIAGSSDRRLRWIHENLSRHRWRWCLRPMRRFSRTAVAIARP